MIMILLLQILKCLLLLTLDIIAIILFLKEIRRISLVDVLLNSDVNEVLAENTEEYEVERLSKVLGEKFYLL